MTGDGTEAFEFLAGLLREFRGEFAHELFVDEFGKTRAKNIDVVQVTDGRATCIGPAGPTAVAQFMQVD